MKLQDVPKAVGLRYDSWEEPGCADGKRVRYVADKEARELAMTEGWVYYAEDLELEKFYTDVTVIRYSSEWDRLSLNGGDEDWVVIVPRTDNKNMEDGSWVAERLAVCNYTGYIFKNIAVFITCHA